MDMNWITGKPIAHRGFWTNGIPENSVAAFNRATKKGFLSELDVHLTIDGQVVVFHDDFLSRVTNRNELISQLSWEEIKKINISNTKYTIPLLEDVLKVVNKKQPLFIEVKSEEQATPREVIDLCKSLWQVLKKYHGPIVIVAFDPVALQWFMRTNSKIPRMLNVSPTGGHKLILRVGTTDIVRFDKYIKMTNPSVIGFDILKTLPSPIYQRAKELNIPTIAWIANTPALKKIAIQYCDSYIFERIGG
jgi:glycerophosphoryl diester phosphodiesterase